MLKNTPPPSGMAELLTSKAPARATVPQTTEVTAGPKPLGVRIVEPTLDVPPHMASMVGARRQPGIGAGPSLLAGRQATPLFDGPTAGLVTARDTLAGLRSTLANFLQTSAVSIELVEAVLKAQETDEDLRRLMQLEGLDPVYMAEVLTRFRSFLDFCKPPAPAAPATAA